VLANTRLKDVFGFTPTRTGAQAFEEYLASHPGVART
jgi:UDP-glucose 4-epimerase